MTIWIIMASVCSFGLIAFAILAWVKEEPFDRYKFEYWIHVFAKYRQDGSKLTFRHATSGASLQFLRTRGADDRCTLMLMVPRSAWSEAKEQKLKSVLADMGCEYQESSEIRSDWLVEAPILIENVRNENSGAAPARIAHRALDALDLGNSEKFLCNIEGALTRRYKFEARESDY